MMSLPEMFESLPVARAVGWTLLHFVWQGAAIATLLGLLLLAMCRRSAGARYVERTASVDDLRPFLREWREAAPDRGWAATESFEIVSRLLGEP